MSGAVGFALGLILVLLAAQLQSSEVVQHGQDTIKTLGATRKIQQRYLQHTYHYRITYCILSKSDQVGVWKMVLLKKKWNE